MSEWKEYKIEDFCEVIGGGTPSTKEDSYYGGNISWITPRDLTNYKKRFISRGERTITELGLKNSSARILPKNSILLTSRAPIGYLVIAENEVCTNQGFKSLIINPEKADYNFVYYLIKSNVERIKGLGTGTTFAEISGSVVKNLKFSLPDLPTQTAIAEILSSLDDKIELNNKINQELENLAQTLFKQWFIDFEFPNENGEPYKSSGGEMVDSELGEIPKGWTAEVLSETTKLIRGISYRKPELVLKGEGIAFVNLKCFALNGTFRQNGIKYYNGKYKPEQILCSNDILVAVTDLTQDREIIGMPILWNGSTTALPSLDTCIIRSETSELKNFLYYEFKTKRYKSRIIEHANGSTVLHLSVKGLETYIFPLPNDGTLKKWCGIIQPILETINSNINEIYELSKTRDYLLPKLISGELSINEITN
jgi:type I restriction enzyme S subunit